MTRTSTILLVEDNPDDVLLMTRAMRKAGLCNAIQVVTDGAQAIDYLAGKDDYNNRQEHPLPDCVFLDLKLPRLSGLEVLQWIRQRPETSRLVVIIFTSSNLQADLDRAFQFKANSYVVKPASFKDLVDLALAFKAGWLESLADHEPAALRADGAARPILAQNPFPGNAGQLCNYGFIFPTHSPPAFHPSIASQPAISN